MKTATITYTYNPATRSLKIYENGKCRGGFNGPEGERRFAQLLESGAEISLTDMETKARHSMLVKRLRGLWIKQGIDSYREAILESYGVSSTTDLTDQQLEELIRKYSGESYPPASDKVRKLRSEILSLVNKLGVYSDPGDWNKVNLFFMSPKISGKLLYQMDEQELITMRRKLHSILSKHGANAIENARQQMLN